MPSRPWYQWYVHDFWADTRLLSPEERGAYRDLLDALWVYGPLANSDRVRAEFIGYSTRKSRVLWRNIAHFFLVNNAEFDHWRIAEQRAQATEKSKKARQSAEARWHANANASAHADAHANGMHARSARARPKSDKDKPPLSALDLDGSSRAHARTREPGARLSAEQLEERDRLQAELEQRRRAAGIGEGESGPRGVASVAALAAPKSESESGG